MTENTPGDSSDDGLNRPPLAGKRIVRINDAQAPFRFIALYALDAIPRKGDAILIRLNESQPPSLYRVETVAHNPFDPQAQVNIGVLYFDPQSGPAQPGQMTEAAARERMDQIVKSQLQLLEKAQAYTNVIIVAGYAGSLALWNFAKPNMTSRGVNWTVLLIGLSLVAFVTWEVVVMIYRATAMSAFGKSVREKPTDFFRLFDEYSAGQQRRVARNYTLWKVTLAPTLVAGYAGALLIIYNAAANIFGLPQWP